MSAPPVRRPRLLVIDDEPSICELIGDVATVVGFDVDLASTPGEIDSRLGKGHDLVVLDLQLGGEDGISAMRTLAIRSPGARVLRCSAPATSPSPSLRSGVCSKTAGSACVHRR